MERIIATARMGFYTDIFENIMTDCGLKVLKTSQINQDIIKKGVKHSSDMMCFPFKVVLGSFIDGLDRGANTIVMWGDQRYGRCRFNQYYNICNQILTDLGYKFEMVNIIPSFFGVIKSLSNLTGKSSIYIVRRFPEVYKTIVEKEKEHFVFNENSDLKIGIVGEIYTVLEPYVNYDIIEKLKKLEVNIDVSISLSHYLKRGFSVKSLRDERRVLKPYITANLGGHAKYSLYSSIQYAKKKYDGIIHLLPLSCMPETTIEMLMNRVSKQYNIPIYRFPVDENRFEAGFDTRIETFISILRRKKQCISG